MVDRRAIWPPLPDGHLLRDEAGLVLVDKPAGVASQPSGEPEGGAGVSDDIVARTREHLMRRDVDGRRPIAPVALTAQHWLDRAASGVVVLARDRAVGRTLAEHFRDGRVERRYCAGVVGWTGHGRGRRTLSHCLARSPDGTLFVAAKNDRAASLVSCEVELLESREGRAIVEVVPDGPHTQQGRAQLAASGIPVAGDRVYAPTRDASAPNRDLRASAPRLLFHASSISVPNADGRSVAANAPVPPQLTRWLAQGDVSPFQARADDSARAIREVLDAARECRWGLGRSGVDAPANARTTAFRLLNEDGEGLPDVAVDVYGDHLVAHLYADLPAPQRALLLDSLHELGFAGVYVKNRPRQANTLGDTRTDALAPREPLRGAAADDEVEVWEHGVPYLARLGDGLSTGIFLDQRDNRARVRGLSAGKRVLNLFAYTCSFTIAAALGGATRTVSVDASRVALDRGRRGLAHAGAAGEHHALLAEDVFEYVARARRRGERFDLVILDPPSYSSVGESRFSASSDYKKLASSAMALVDDGGALLACSNHRQTVRAKLRRLLHEAARDAEIEVTQMKDLATPADFPPAWGKEPHFKSVLVRVTRSARARRKP